MFAKVVNSFVLFVFCNLAILIFASTIQCGLMTTLIIIIGVYIAVNLALLAFKSVREAWPSILTVYDDLSSLWKGFFSKDLKWWEWPLSCMFFLVMEPILILLMVLFTLVPVPVYLRALFTDTHKKNAFREIPPPEEWGTNTARSRVVFDADLPFKPNFEDVFYVEDEFNPTVNEYIAEHYEELCKRFAKQSLVFNYFPKLCKQIVPQDTLLYMFPYMKADAVCVNGNISLETLKKHLACGSFDGPALIHAIKTDLGDDCVIHAYSYYPLVPDSNVSLNDQFEWYTLSVCSDDYIGPHYKIEEVGSSSGDDSDAADRNFDAVDIDFRNDYAHYLIKAEDLKLVEEVRDRIKELCKRGYQLSLLQNLIEEQPTLSRMVITKNYRIFLPDYNNVEITMSPLPKAVYLLFLKHPEGILFKYLGDYYEELLDIYKEIGNRVIERNVRKSIHDITDPTNNSINEKCARIREAFLKHFDTPYAKNYYITGLRGEPKRITLPRELVDLQAL